ncbi:MAG: hypothetical protein HY261_03025 [Chloroflexi bacterium]|nr:hypothetical protein [Chloroflexota bacterium]
MLERIIAIFFSTCVMLAVGIALSLPISSLLWPRLRPLAYASVVLASGFAVAYMVWDFEDNYGSSNPWWTTGDFWLAVSLLTWPLVLMAFRYAWLGIARVLAPPKAS